MTLRPLPRFSLLFLAIAVPVLSLVHFAVRSTLDGARELVARRSFVAAELGAFSVDEYVRGVDFYFEAYARSPALRGACRRRDERGSRAILREIVESNPRVDRAFLTDTTATEWSDYPHDPAVMGLRFAHRDWFRGVTAAGSTYVSSAYFREAGSHEYTVAVACPVRDGDATLGYLVGQILVASLETQLGKASESGIGDLLFLDRDGAIATGSHSAIDPELRVRLHAIVRQAAGGDSVQTVTLRRGRYVVAYSPVASLSGCVLAVRDLDQAIAPVRTMAWIVYALAAAIGLLLALIAHGMLERRARRIEDLRRAERDLGHLVAQRTADLSQANELLRLEVAERRKAEESLRVSEGRFRATFEQAAVGIAHVGADGHWLRVNQRLCDILGYTHEEILARSLPDVVRIDGASGDALPIARLGEWRNGICSVERQLVQKPGSLIWCQLTVAPVLGASGEPEYYTAVIEDIGARKRLEEQFLQSQKMRAIGQLAGGIAHDFNNLLTAILGYGELLKRSIPKDDPSLGYVEEIRIAGERASGLTAQLLAFSRKQLLQPVVLDLNELVERMDRMLRRLIGENISLEMRLAPGLGAVLADRSQIEQVILNLVVNGRDAMSTGGRLLVETKNVELDSEAADSFPGLHSGRYAMVAVSDTGSGMDAATQAQLFEPFFTTKEKGKGTGLGLSTVYGIVKQSGGTVTVYSEVGKGSTFKVYLPRTDAERAPAPVEPIPEHALQGSETVLLVEDDAMLRSLTRRVLEESGYTVLEASSGKEALAVGERHTGPIHAMLTDVVMPRMSGAALSKRLVKLHPETKVIYMSGYTDEAIVRQGVLDPSVVFVQKPYSPAGLLRKLRGALDSGDPPRGTAPR